MKAKVLFLIVFLAGTADAQTRRALLVGIDHYLRPDASQTFKPSEKTTERMARLRGKPSRSDISDLEGAVNDATQLRELLIQKYRFEAKDIVVLKDGEATADNILNTLQTHLVDTAKPGDVSFFFYAGHGSQIRNILTRNLSGMDSTLVPANALLGVPDIRSKELARIYLQARKKNVELTVVQDSCFSGGGIRGLRPDRKSREVEPDGQLSVAETLDGPLPEEQGVLFFSASQDYQPAEEITDDRLGTHGAFTWAFLQALATSGENERADRIFQRTRALMQSKVCDQEPVLLQSPGRTGLGLFGQPADSFGAATAAVGFVQREPAMLELNSGITMGLAPGSELKRISPSGPTIRIRVTEVNGPSSANAVPVEPSQIAEISPGNLFQLDKLVVPDEQLLKLYVGDAAPAAELERIVRLAAENRTRRLFELLEDPTEKTPTHVMVWDGNEKLWVLSENRTDGNVLMKAGAPSADAIAKILTGQNVKARLAILVPIATELAANLSFASHGNIVSITRSLRDADYFLAGRVTVAGGIEYAWARSSVTQEDLQRQEAEARREKQSLPLSGWPPRSDWVASDQPEGLSGVGRQLAEKGLTLAKIAGWLQLRTPVPDDAIPYDIGLRDRTTSQLSEGELTGDREYDLILRFDRLPQTRPVTARRVYIFVLDCYGKSKLVFGNGNADNVFPRKDVETLSDDIDLRVVLKVVPPYGIDNYFLLTSEQPIDDPETVFNFDGLRTARGAGPAGPLARLIESRAEGTRGAISGVPTNWSISRIPFRSNDPGVPK